MTLSIQESEKILQSKLGQPTKTPTDKVIGFTTPIGKVLAVHREAAETRIWFEPPAPPTIEGVRLMDSPSNGNSNLVGQLLPLTASTTLRVEVESSEALVRFLDWYLGDKSVSESPLGIAPHTKFVFSSAYQHFQDLVEEKSGHPFKDFNEGLAAVWENYKPRLRERALELLNTPNWSEGDIGSGVILNHMIAAIEIQESSSTLDNNLVFWQNRFGHANRDHKVLLEAVADPKLKHEIEDLLFGLYRGDLEDGVAFDRLSELTGGKYPLLAYFYFLKDMDQFMPIQPTGFDRAFCELGIDFTTLRQCSWENYVMYNQTLENLRPQIAVAADLENVRLIDAHSFCWIFSTLLKQETTGALENSKGGNDQGRILGGSEKTIVAMCLSIENTVRNSNGQTVERTSKNKELRMTSAQLEKLMTSLYHLQEGRCALTGLKFSKDATNDDKNLLPSPDRIDSNGHYEEDNLQIVCRFINFWKSDTDNEEFKRLLMLVRDMDFR